MTGWKDLAKPFPDSEVKQRPGAATWDHKDACQGPRCRDTRDPAKHIQFSYVDARAVAQRLDDVVSPEGWEFTSNVIPGTDIVHGRLTVAGIVREDYGYPNSERDEEPIKAASSDALKRCAVLFGIGRHLYDDNKSHRTPSVSAGRVAPLARPVARTSTDVPEFPDDGLQDGPRARETAQDGPDNSDCPIHHVTWNGEWGDLWHKTDDGVYCRHPENIARGPRKAAGARR